MARYLPSTTLNRKNASFAGHDANAENWVILVSIIEICILNKIEPQVYLTGVFTAIAHGHRQKDIEDLFPCSFGKWSNSYEQPTGTICKLIMKKKRFRSSTILLLKILLSPAALLVFLAILVFKKNHWKCAVGIIWSMTVWSFAFFEPFSLILPFIENGDVDLSTLFGSLLLIVWIVNFLFILMCFIITLGGTFSGNMAEINQIIRKYQDSWDEK